MKTICIIINGISLPYQAIDYAIGRAKKNSCGIHAIFLKGTREPPKGYLYPSDLRTIETGASDEESVKEDEQIIKDTMKLVKEFVTDESIPFTLTLRTNASINEVATLTDKADLVVIDKNFDDMCLLSNNKISLKDIQGEIAAPVYVVPSE